MHNSAMSLESRIGQLWESSKYVLDDCALDNGAIIAANPSTKLATYPPDAVNYRYSWPRDAAFQLLATKEVDPSKVEDRAVNYAKWLENIEGYRKTGVLVKRYNENGSMDTHYGEQYQPDQAGALMYALDAVIPDKHLVIDAAIRRMADGLHDRWRDDSFGVTQDLWENRETTDENGDVFTYSLAAATAGLGSAIKRFKGTYYADEKWQRTYESMSIKLDKGYTTNEDGQKFYVRKIYPNPMYNGDADNTLDASLAGLVYPFRQQEAVTNFQHSTVMRIHSELYADNEKGIKRYKGDKYDGIVRPGGKESNAGAWPLLSFWESIALDEIGEPERARDLYNATVTKLNAAYRLGQIANNMIPEQLFADGNRQGKAVLPLGWSHAKFVLATRALKVID